MDDSRRLVRQRQDQARAIDRRYLVTGQPHPRLIVRTKDGGHYPTARWRAHLCDVLRATFEEREDAPVLLEDAGYTIHVGNLSRSVPPVGKVTIAYQDVGRWWMLPPTEFPCLEVYKRTAQRRIQGSEGDDAITLPWFATCGSSSSTDSVELCDGCDVPPCCGDACSACGPTGYAPHTWAVTFDSGCVISEPPTVMRCVDLTRRTWRVEWESDCVWTQAADTTDHVPGITIRRDPSSDCIELEVTHGEHYLCYAAPMPDSCCAAITLHAPHPDCPGCGDTNDCPCADEITIAPSERGIGCDAVGNS